MFENLISNLKNIGGYVNKKLLLTAVLKILEEHCRHRVDEYDLIYNPLEKKVDFNVYAPGDIALPAKYNTVSRDRLYNFGGEALYNQIANAAESVAKMPQDSVLEVAIMTYRKSGKEIVLYVTYKDQNNQQFKLTQTL